MTSQRFSRQLRHSLTMPQMAMPKMQASAIPEPIAFAERWKSKGLPASHANQGLPVAR